MTWTAPEPARSEPPIAGPERQQLDAWLDYHRQTLLAKCAGLTGEQLAAATVPPSNLTLLGLVRHMAEVERAWFRTRFAAEPTDWIYGTDEQPDADLENLDPAAAEQDYATFVRGGRAGPGRRRAPRPGRDLLQRPPQGRHGPALDLPAHD